MWEHVAVASVVAVAPVVAVVAVAPVVAVVVVSVVSVVVVSVSPQHALISGLLLTSSLWSLSSFLASFVCRRRCQRGRGEGGVGCRRRRGPS